MILQPGQSYTYNMKNLPPENERPENLYLSAFCSRHTEETVGELDKYDGTPEDKDPQQGQVKLESDDFNAMLTMDKDKVTKSFSGTGYISGITGCAHHEDINVYMEEDGNKRIEQVTYPEQDNITLKNEIDKKTGDVTFTYGKKEQPPQEEQNTNTLKPGDSYNYNIQNPPEKIPDNLYLSAFCHTHADDTVGDLEKHDNKPEDSDSKTGYVKIENDKYKATMTKEGEKIVKDFEGTGYLMGITGDCHHEDVKVHVEQEGDKLTEQVTYPEQNGMTLRNEMNMNTGDVTFKFLK